MTDPSLAHDSPAKRFKIDPEYNASPTFLQSGSSTTSWMRPALPDIDECSESVIFQWIDIFLDREHGSILIDTVNRVLTRNNPKESRFVFRTSIVLAVSVSRRQEVKESLFGYHFGQKSRFLRVVCESPSFVPRIRQVFSDGISLPGIGVHRFQCYEANIPFTLRFMIDRSIVGGNWLELPAGKYRIHRGVKRSSCQLEAFLDYEDLVSHPIEGEYQKIAPLRILSFDIECMAESGAFCEAEKDPVIQIANVLQIQGESVPFCRNVFVLDSCKPISGAEVYSFGNESDLLKAWAEFVVRIDPDIITGYNIANFDFPYILNRAKTLKAPGVDLLGRLVGRPSKLTEKTFSSSAYGKSESKEISMEGRVVFDMIQYMRRNHKLSSYSLNSVSTTFLGQQKEDVHYKDICRLQTTDDETRRRIAVYCLKDSYLPLLLMEKLMVVINYIEMARVSGVPIPYLLSRGQQIKVLSMIYRRARQDGFLIPTLNRDGASSLGEDDTYEGATVIEPKTGYYADPIVTLDFASLYPSIMRAHNLCYTTLVSKDDLPRLQPDQYFQTPTGDTFVRSSVRVGILPQILKTILEQRKIAKRDMAAATDPMIRAVQDGRQLALKISANSVYGFTGALIGQLPCLAISSSVTAIGREMIEKTKNYVESNYDDANVIYGDTDSVMVKFKGITTVEAAMKMGREAAERVSRIFPDPVKLEFEKVYYPYLLMNKKRYAGLYWTNAVKYDKLDAKGIETVRRDNCLLVRNLVNTSLKKILIDRDVDGAIQYVKQTIADLLQNKLDISLLVITKALVKSATSDGYAAKQAHVELAERMRKRDKGSAPQVGDRVAYVIVEGAKGDPTYMKSEDPIYVLENDIPIDVQYYLHNQLSKPLTRIFGPIIKSPQSLLEGEHTRTVTRPKATTNKGIMQFATRRENCLCCKACVPDKRALCANCHSREIEVFGSLMSEVKVKEETFGRIWSECQHCQQSVTQHILCTSRDCPIFYQRKKVQKDLDELYEKLRRFES